MTWRVLEHGSAAVAFTAYQEMLIHAARCLPKGVKVILLADRGFVHTDAMSALLPQRQTPQATMVWPGACHLRTQQSQWRTLGRGQR